MHIPIGARVHAFDATVRDPPILKRIRPVICAEPHAIVLGLPIAFERIGRPRFSGVRLGSATSDVAATLVAIAAESCTNSRRLIDAPLTFAKRKVEDDSPYVIAFAFKMRAGGFIPPECTGLKPAARNSAMISAIAHLEFVMRSGPLSQDQLADFERDGFIVVPKLFDAEEIDLLLRAAKEDRALDEHSFGRADGEGGTVRLSLWNHPGDGIYGMFARCERMVDACEQTARRRGVPLPLEDDHEGREGRRGVGVAPGLRLLVPERRAVPRPA